MTVHSLSNSSAFQKLKQHFHQLSAQGVEIRNLFEQDSKRFDHFSIDAAGLLLDYSKNRLTSDTLNLLCDLAREQDVESQRAAMFAGEKINFHRKPLSPAHRLARA